MKVSYVIQYFENIFYTTFDDESSKLVRKPLNAVNQCIYTESEVKKFLNFENCSENIDSLIEY